MILLPIISIVILSIITWFDFKDKSIPIVLLISETLIIFFYFISLDIPGYFPIVLINLILIVINIGLLYLWFKLRYNITTFFDKIIGWGDIFLFGIAALIFETMTFLAFIVISAFLGCIYGISLRWYYHKKKQSTIFIPLAGIMAGLLTFITISHLIGFNLLIN